MEAKDGDSPESDMATAQVGIGAATGRPAQGDAVEGAAWAERPAGSADPATLYNRGVQLAATEPTEAARWWEQAASMGDARSMSALGYHWRALDPARSREWYERAAAAGDTYAMCQIAQRLDPLDIGPRFGRRNLAEAHRWYAKAAELGHPVAQFVVGWRLIQWDGYGT